VRDLRTPGFVSNDKIISDDPLSQWRRLVKKTQFFVNYADHWNSSIKTFIRKQENKTKTRLGLNSVIRDDDDGDRQDDLSQVPSLKVFDTVKRDMEIPI